MTSFPETVLRVLDDLRAKHRFVPALAGSGKRFVSFVRQESEEVFVYVFVHDGRPDGSNLDVDLWVAPPESADHSLDKLGVGFKICIGSEFHIDNDFFYNCQMRIVHFLTCVSALVPLVLQELDSPFFHTKRWAIYNLERKALRTMLEKARTGNMAATLAVDSAIQLANGNGRLDRLEQNCLQISIDLLKSEALDDDALLFFDNDPALLASCLATHLYARALGQMSAARV